MRSYRIDLTKTENGWLADCKAFEIAIDAVELENAIQAVRSECECEALERLMSGQGLPDDTEIDENNPFAVYFNCAAKEIYEARDNANVRRNISLPAWMDKMLRRANVDASKLFQDAAIAKLKELDGTPNISTTLVQLTILNAVREKMREQGIDPGDTTDDVRRLLENMYHGLNAVTKKISSVSELEDACLPGVLDDYFERKLDDIVKQVNGRSNRTTEGEV